MCGIQFPSGAAAPTRMPSKKRKGSEKVKKLLTVLLTAVMLVSIFTGLPVNVAAQSSMEQTQEAKYDNMPSIEHHTSSQYCLSGDKVTFTVTATGSNLKYQWQKSTDDGFNWSNCTSAGAKTSKFTFSASKNFDGWRYRCEVSNSYGSVVTSYYGSGLYVDRLPYVYYGPSDETVYEDDTASVSCYAEGAKLSFRWQRSKDGGQTWINCTSKGADTTYFAFTASMAYNGWRYRCKVSNPIGTVYTDSMKLTVKKAPPYIQWDPWDQEVESGEEVSFSVTASGRNLTYQWQRSTDGGKTWKNCTSDGATKATFTFVASKNYNGWQYRCKVTNDVGSATSYPATLTVNVIPPTIYEQPESLKIPAGETGSFYVWASNNAVSYQWQKSTDGGKTWKDCSSSSAKTSEMTFTANQAYNGWKYRCKIWSRSAYIYTNVVKLTVTAPLPVITKQPNDPRVFNGDKTTLSVAAKGTGLTYQWYRSSGWDSDWVACTSASAKTANFTFTASPTYDGWRYYCAVKNESGTVRSETAYLTVSKYGRTPTGCTNSLMTYEEKCNLLFGRYTSDPRSFYSSSAEAQKHMTSVTVQLWDLNSSGGKVTRTKTFTVHEKLAPTVKALFAEIYALPEKPPIHSLGGFRAGSGNSEHNIGAAIDVNPTENYYCDPNGNAITGSFFKPGENPYSMPIDGSVQQIFAKYGFRRGIYWNSGYKDYMHYSLFGT